MTPPNWLVGYVVNYIPFSYHCQANIWGLTPKCSHNSNKSPLDLWSRGDLLPFSLKVDQLYFHQ